MPQVSLLAWFRYSFSYGYSKLIRKHGPDTLSAKPRCTCELSSGSILLTTAVVCSEMSRRRCSPLWDVGVSIPHLSCRCSARLGTFNWSGMQSSTGRCVAI